MGRVAGLAASRDPDEPPKLRPQAVQSGSDVSPTPGVESSLMWAPSESVMNKPGAENTI